MSSYYDLPCETQAEHVRLLATLRDEGKSEGQVQAHIAATFPAEHAAALNFLVPEVFLVRSMTPADWFRAARTDCESHGKTVPSTTLRKPLVPRGVVSGQEADACRLLGQRIDSDRLQLTQYEKRLAADEADLAASADRVARLGDLASDDDIDAHNLRVTAFNSLNQEYRNAASSHNRNVERYNRECGGKAAF